MGRFLGFGVFGLWLAGASSAQATPCAGAKRAYDYPIVLKGTASLRGYRADSLVAYARRPSGSWERVALQVDEVNARGDFVLHGGLPYTARTDDGVFDANDEVVIDGATLGEAFADADVPEVYLANAKGAHRAHFCRKGVFLGELLVVAGRQRAPLWGLPPQVSFTAETGALSSELYRYVFPKANPALLGEVFLKRGGRELPLTRSSRFVMPLKTAFFMMPDMSFDEEDFTSSIESWQAGPLRTIVAVGVKYSAFLSIFRLHLFSELVFFRNRFQVPTVIEFVFDPARYLAPGSGIAYALSFPPGRPVAISSNLVRLPAEAPDKVVTQGPRASAFDLFYAEGHAAEGSLRVEVRIDAKARAQVPPPFRIEAGDFADEKRKKHWPWLADLSGDLGVFLDFSEVHQGSYEFGLDLLLSSDANERFTDYGNIEAELHRISGSAAGAGPNLMRPGKSRH